MSDRRGPIFPSPVYAGPPRPQDKRAPAAAASHHQRPQNADAGRVPRACERCHTLKAKCMPGDKVGVCIKCQRSGSVCHPHRRRRRDNNKTALLNRQNHAAPRAPPLQTAPINTTAYPTPMPEIAVDRVPYPIPTNGAVQPVEPQGRPEGDVEMQDPIDRGLLTLEEARQCLASFVPLQEHFPCVEMTNFDFDNVRKNRPFLFLCILASTTSLIPETCSKLDLLVKETIGHRIVTLGEKSEDLMEGLLVYLAWYHFHFKPSNQRPYQLVQMAIGMAIDLGLPSTKRIKFDRVTFIASATALDAFRARQSVNIDRAVVACWYLSSTFSIATCKPNNFSLRGFVSQSIERFSESAKSPADRRFLELVRLQRSAESISLRMVEDVPVDTNQAARYQHVKDCLLELDVAMRNWQEKVPPQAKSAAFMITSCEYAKVLIYESALQCLQDYVSVDPAPNEAPKMQEESLSLQKELLHKQLEAVDVYLSAFLKYSVLDLLHITVWDWIRITFIVVALSKLSLTERGVAGWDAAAARENVKLGQYLEIFSYRAQKLSQGQTGPGSTQLKPPKQQSQSQSRQNKVENFAWSFHHIMETMQLWYSAQLKALDVRSAAPEDGTTLDPCPLEYLEVDMRRRVLDSREAAAAAAGAETGSNSRAESAEGMAEMPLGPPLDLGMDFGSSDWNEVFHDWTLFPEMVMANFSGVF